MGEILKTSPIAQGFCKVANSGRQSFWSLHDAWCSEFCEASGQAGRCMRLRVPTVPLLSALVMALLGAINVAQAADYRATQAGKLNEARGYVTRFLVEDADPKQVFFIRDVEFPVWKDFPVGDCGMYGVVRAVEQRGEPRFDSAKANVVLVPVVAELLLIKALADGGPAVGSGEEGKSWCSFEYERYNHLAKRFERVPGFREQEFNIAFKSWGDYLFLYRTYSMPEGFAPNILVAIDTDKRYVRYDLRVSVSREKPYRLGPQIPRLWYAKDAIEKLQRIIKETEHGLAHRISDREPSAKGEELEQDLRAMRVQNQERDWVIRSLTRRLEALKDTAPFSDLDVRLPIGGSKDGQ